MKLLGTDLRDELRVPVTKDGGRSGGCVGVGRVVLGDLQGQCDEVRIAVANRDPTREPLFVRELDDAPIGEARDHEVRHALNRLLVVE